VLGGARSGKSCFAQRIAAEHKRVSFIATATASDPEMEQRIERHRQGRPHEWQTLEVPTGLDMAISSLGHETELAIIDCLTLYLANVMDQEQSRVVQIEEHMQRFCAALEDAHVPIVVVSNEVGSGVHATTATGRLFADLLGSLNQRVAALSENVIMMMAGIPVLIKGRVPSLSCESERTEPSRTAGLGV